MGNRASPEPPPQPPKWQRVIAPPAREAREAAEQSVIEVPADRLDDPRERAPDFARLPEHAKNEIRGLWLAQEGARADQVLRRKESAHRWVVEGAALLFLSVALLQMPTRLGLALAAAVGAGVGWIGARTKPGPIAYGLLFAAANALFAAFWGFRNLVYGILSVPIVLVLAAALALTHRVQRSDRTEI